MSVSFSFRSMFLSLMKFWDEMKFSKLMSTRPELLTSDADLLLTDDEI